MLLNFSNYRVLCDQDVFDGRLVLEASNGQRGTPTLWDPTDTPMQSIWRLILSLNTTYDRWDITGEALGISREAYHLHEEGFRDQVERHFDLLLWSNSRFEEGERAHGYAGTEHLTVFLDLTWHRPEHGNTYDPYNPQNTSYGDWYVHVYAMQGALSRGEARRQITHYLVPWTFQLDRFDPFQEDPLVLDVAGMELGRHVDEPYEPSYPAIGEPQPSIPVEDVYLDRGTGLTPTELYHQLEALGRVVERGSEPTGTPRFERPDPLDP